MDDPAGLKALGITLPGPAYLFGSILFGFIGMAAFQYGRKTERPATKWIGVALMAYPYAISQTWLLYAVGAALCAGIFFTRDQS